MMSKWHMLGMRKTARGSAVVLGVALVLGTTSKAEEWVRYGGTLSQKRWVEIYTNNPNPKTSASMRILIGSNDVALLCRGVNLEQRPIARVGRYSDGNNLIFVSGDRERPERAANGDPSLEGILDPGKEAIWFRGFKDHGFYDFNRYPVTSKLVWRFMTARSRPIWLSAPIRSGGFGGWPSDSMKTNKTIAPMLAYVPSSTNGGEMAFILWNGTGQPVEIGKATGDTSRLCAMASGTEIVQELAIRELLGTNVVAAPETLSQWLAPLRAVTNLLSPSAMSRIREAGGDLDIVWKVGASESDPLPLFVGDRPKTGVDLYYEMQDEFLKKHAHVRRITADMRVDLSLRLAGPGSEPMFSVRIVNEERESLLGSCEAALAMSGRLSYGIFANSSAKIQCAGYFVIQPKEEVELRSSLSKLREWAFWNGTVANVFLDSFGHTNGNMWVALPDMRGELPRIKAFTEYDLSLPPRNQPKRDKRPPRPVNSPIALPPIAAILAFVYTGETTSGLACVLWNRTDTAIAAANPLTAKSRIVASAPAIGYKRELEMADVEMKEITIAPNTHTDWRLPWKTVESLIPVDDLAKIKAAGGELDLIWKVGAWESTPLPLLMTDPEEVE